MARRGEARGGRQEAGAGRKTAGHLIERGPPAPPGRAERVRVGGTSEKLEAREVHALDTRGSQRHTPFAPPRASDRLRHGHAK